MRGRADGGADGDLTLQSIGIRRWKLQRALCDFTAHLGIPITFGKRVRAVRPVGGGGGEGEGGEGGEGKVDATSTATPPVAPPPGAPGASPPSSRLRLEFEDGTWSVVGDVVFGADGVKSRVRDTAVVVQDGTKTTTTTEVPYTGTTCLMGAAPVARPMRGICFPSSSTTKCHACYYPTNDQETVFQVRPCPGPGPGPGRRPTSGV